jgi:hypothetical protein
VDSNWKLYQSQLTKPEAFDRKTTAMAGELLSSSSGLMSLRYPRLDGVMVTLHSQYDPMAESLWYESMFKPGQLDPGCIVIVLGFGLAYHLVHLAKGLRQLEKPPKLWAVDLHPDLFLYAMNHVDMAGLLKYPDLQLFFHKDLAAVEVALRKALESQTPSSLRLIPHPPSLSLNREAYLALSRRLPAFLELLHQRRNAPAFVERLKHLLPNGLDAFKTQTAAEALLANGGPYSRQETCLLALDAILVRE